MYQKTKLIKQIIKEELNKLLVKKQLIKEEVKNEILKFILDSKIIQSSQHDDIIYFVISYDTNELKNGNIRFNIDYRTYNVKYENGGHLTQAYLIGNREKIEDNFVYLLDLIFYKKKKWQDVEMFYTTSPGKDKWRFDIMNKKFNFK